MPKRPAPFIAEKANEAILIQIQEKRRSGAKGNLEFKKSKTLTVYNLTLDEVYSRIKKSLMGD
jgi:hypothetical protein